MRRFAIPTLLVLALAATALAATLAEVTTDANALLIEYEDLEDRIDACPGGTCQEAQDILDDLSVAATDLGALHADRATLNPCSTCTSVDVTIDDIDDLNLAAAENTAGWDEG